MLLKQTGAENLSVNEHLANRWINLKAVTATRTHASTISNNRNLESGITIASNNSLELYITVGIASRTVHPQKFVTSPENFPLENSTVEVSL